MNRQRQVSAERDRARQRDGQRDRKVDRDRVRDGGKRVSMDGCRCMHG